MYIVQPTLDWNDNYKFLQFENENLGMILNKIKEDQKHRYFLI